jgi:predicted MFS family arabinose efflux permease
LPIVTLTFLAYFVIGLPLAIIPIFVRNQLGFSAVLAGLAVSAQYIATILCRSKVGRMTDELGPRRTSLIGFMGILLGAGLTLATALLAHWPLASLLALFASRLALGAGEGTIGTSSIAWGIARAGPEHSVRAMSWNGIATYGGLAVGAPAGVALAAWAGLPAIAACTALVALLGFGLTWSKADARLSKPQTGARPGAWTVLRSVLPYGAALALASVGFGVITAFITLFYADRHWPGAAFAVSSFGVAFIAVRLLLPYPMRRFGGLRTALGALLIELVGLILIWRAATPVVALSAAALVGFGFGPIFPCLGKDAMGDAPPDAQGEALGLYSLFLDVALGASGPAAGALIGHFGYSSPFALAAACVTCAFGLVLWTLMRRDGLPRQAEP